MCDWITEQNNDKSVKRLNYKDNNNKRKQFFSTHGAQTSVNPTVRYTFGV